MNTHARQYHLKISEDSIKLKSDIKQIEKRGKELKRRILQLESVHSSDCPLCKQQLTHDHKDKVLAVIKASAINNDGHSIGVMAPNPDGQREVIEALYVKSGINPRDIQYIEAHGTGTKIGDPSEVRALSNAFKRWNRKI